VGFPWSEGVEVMVKPPAFGREGMKTSSHWPGRNFTLMYVVRLGASGYKMVKATERVGDMYL
jgi:hypothetical protein